MREHAAVWREEREAGGSSSLTEARMRKGARAEVADNKSCCCWPALWVVVRWAVSQASSERYEASLVAALLQGLSDSQPGRQARGREGVSATTAGPLHATACQWPTDGLLLTSSFSRHLQHWHQAREGRVVAAVVASGVQQVRTQPLHARALLNHQHKHHPPEQEAAAVMLEESASQPRSAGSPPCLPAGLTDGWLLTMNGCRGWSASRLRAVAGSGHSPVLRSRADDEAGRSSGSPPDARLRRRRRSVPRGLLLLLLASDKNRASSGARGCGCSSSRGGVSVEELKTGGPAACRGLTHTTDTAAAGGTDQLALACLWPSLCLPPAYSLPIARPTDQRMALEAGKRMSPKKMGGCCEPPSPGPRGRGGNTRSSSSASSSPPLGCPPAAAGGWGPARAALLLPPRLLSTAERAATKRREGELLT